MLKFVICIIRITSHYTSSLYYTKPASTKLQQRLGKWDENLIPQGHNLKCSSKLEKAARVQISLSRNSVSTLINV